jgi:Stage II sporulation protein E (SpoIIE)
MTQLPIAMFADTQFAATPLEARPGDLLMILTDGRTEVFDGAERELRTPESSGYGSGLTMMFLTNTLLLGSWPCSAKVPLEISRAFMSAGRSTPSGSV